MNLFRKITLFAFMVFALAACDKDGRFSIGSEDPSVPSGSPGRTSTAMTRRVHLLYSAGYNSLAGYLSEDIGDLCAGTLPGTLSVDDVLLVFSRTTSRSQDYTTPVSPVLFRLYADTDGEAVRDTLKVWPADTQASSAAMLREVLQEVSVSFPAKGYGLIFSSHASGWLPEGYYNSPSSFDPDWNASSSWTQGLRLNGTPYPSMGDPSLPPVKSIGQDAGSPAVEMSLRDFASAIPFKLDYIIFDACLMGCVEVAYELRNLAGTLAFSPTEVLAEGLDYKTLSQRLMDNHTPDVVQICKDYFAYYDAQSGVMNSATISVVDTNALDALAALCRELFETYRNGLDSVSASQVQRYYRFSRHWFYDLRDILLHAGLSDADDARLQAALDEAVIYKAATPRFIDAFAINVYSGLSMYLPSDGSSYLDAYYKGNVSWNDATGLVQ